MSPEVSPIARSGSGASEVTLRGVVRDVIDAVAPEEIPLVRALDCLSEAEISRRFARGAKAREPLGFGLAEVAVMATPIVWTAVQQAANRVAGAAADSLIGRVRSGIHTKFKRGKPAAEPPLPHFGDVERAEIRRTILELAQRSCLEADRAVLLAEAVVGRLTFGSLSGGTANADAPAGGS